MSTVIRYANPISGLSSFIDEFFTNNNAFESVDRQLTNGTWPKVDIAENETGYQIKADLPGLDKSEVKVTIENGALRIEGEKKQEQKKENGKYYHLERNYGKFTRTFMLPDEVDSSKIEASMNNGVLELLLPKSEQARPKMIEVKVS